MTPLDVSRTPLPVVIAFVLGLVVVVLGFYIPHLSIERAQDLGEIVHFVEWETPSAGVSWRSCNELSVRYPRTMTFEEDAVIRLRLDASGPPNPLLGGPLRYRQGKLQEPIEVECSSTSFDVTPSGQVEKQPGVTMPLVWVWAASPKQPGSDRILLLDLEDILVASGLDSVASDWLVSPVVVRTLRIVDNGIPRDNIVVQDLRHETLRIDVLTALGIPYRWYLWIRLGTPIIGFILLSPWVYFLVRRFAGRRKRQKRHIIVPP